MPRSKNLLTFHVCMQSLILFVLTYVETLHKHYIMTYVIMQVPNYLSDAWKAANQEEAGVMSITV